MKAIVDSGVLVETAAAAAKAGGTVLRPLFRSGDLEIRAKALNDFVSSADRAAETAVLETLRSRFPEHAFLAEEAGSLGNEDGGYQWVIDPLDGTTNFLQGLAVYAVSVACLWNGQVVAGAIFDPERQDLFVAERGGGAFWDEEPIAVSARPGLAGGFAATGFPFKAQAAIDLYLELFRAVFMEAKAVRRCGAAAIDLAYTAAGIYDGFFEFRLAPWDIAAGALLIEEAGGRVSDLNGDAHYLKTGNVLAGGRGVHADLLRIIGALANESLLDRLVPQSSAGGDGSC